MAARAGCAESVHVLLHYGAEINAVTTKGKFSALHWGAGAGKEAACKALMDHHCDQHLRTSFHETAIMRAKKGGFMNCIEAIVNWHAEGDITEQNSITSHNSHNAHPATLEKRKMLRTPEHKKKKK
jgi:ankyrin repeat protein